jgi:hypothetical protein
MDGSLLERMYLVLPAKQGWAVNLGADTLAVFTSREQARNNAMGRAAKDMAEGTCAGFMEPDLADRLSPPGRC